MHVSFFEEGCFGLKWRNCEAPNFGLPVDFALISDGQILTTPLLLLGKRGSQNLSDLLFELFLPLLAGYICSGFLF
jgi:hypothetical protein